MNYIITNHAKQRREHHDIKDESLLKEWMKAYDDYFKFSLLESGQTYKIHARGNTAVIKKKNRYTVVLITFKSYHKEPSLMDISSLRIRKSENREATLFPIYRINYNGKLVKCGRILKNTKTKEKYTLSLKKNLFKKYVMGYYDENTNYNNLEEIEHLVNLKDDNKYCLNDFERISQ